ncbi:MAG: DUF4276 family protein [Nitrospinae bacterium]|nr:DUF4276 family protein [Nitrospinota bacterium]
MVNVRIYVEGGGASKALLTSCRRGFRTFFEKTSLKGRMPKIIACGSRNDAFSDFVTALKSPETSDFILLLVDSEGPFLNDTNVLSYLSDRDGWGLPKSATKDNVHLMVQCMETWFLADKAALENYFGQGFLTNSLPKNTNIEAIPKKDVLDKLEHASRKSRKGEYGKGSHSFDLLECINPQYVFDFSSNAKNLHAILDEKCT